MRRRFARRQSRLWSRRVTATSPPAISPPASSRRGSSPDKNHEYRSHLAAAGRAVADLAAACAYGAVSFFRERGQPLASTALMAPMSGGFVAELDRFATRHRLPVVLFAKGQRKDEVMAEHLRRFTAEEGVVFIGKAQERASVFRTQKRASAGRVYPWIVKSTAMVNHYYNLRRRSRFRTVLSQVLHLFSVQREAMPQRPRIRQASTYPAGARPPGSRQRHPELRRSRSAATDLRSALRGEDRRRTAQVAAPLVAPCRDCRLGLGQSARCGRPDEGPVSPGVGGQGVKVLKQREQQERRK
jgi:hypothetical protein